MQVNIILKHNSKRMFAITSNDRIKIIVPNLLQSTVAKLHNRLHATKKNPKTRNLLRGCSGILQTQCPKTRNRIMQFFKVLLIWTGLNPFANVYERKREAKNVFSWVNFVYEEKISIWKVINFCVLFGCSTTYFCFHIKWLCLK